MKCASWRMNSNPNQFDIFQTFFIKFQWIRDHPFKTSAFFRGEGVKNLPNLPKDSSNRFAIFRLCPLTLASKSNEELVNQKICNTVLILDAF